MKLAVSILFICFCTAFLPELSELRTAYIKASENKEATALLFKELAEVKKTDDKVLVAYKGAVLTLMAKYIKGKQEKKSYFKEGAAMLNFAANANPNNIEIRVLRMSVQENTPKFLKFQQNLAEDKQFIIDHFGTTSSNEVKVFVRSFIQQSNSFTSEEKDLF